MESLSRKLDTLNLQTSNCVAFVPSRSPHDWDVKLDPIPRYLYRVFDLSSPGESNKDWVRSKDAVRNQPDQQIDIFSRVDRSQAACLLWGHLMWQDWDDDNLMSWTSSLLFAIQYIFYRHNKQWGRPSYKDIRLCVLDTEKVPAGAFIRDLDLIRAFAPFDNKLTKLGKLRSGCYYFGEYLSQGTLNITGHNTIVSAQDMVDKGLLSLRPEFRLCFENHACGWANDVVAMYRTLEQDSAQPEPCQEPESIRIAIKIAQLFGRNSQWHVALSLAAVVPGQIVVETIAKAFREVEFCSKYRKSTLIQIEKIAEQAEEEERLGFSRTCRSQGMSDLVRMREIQQMLRAECYQHDLQDSLLSGQKHIAQAEDMALTLKDKFTSDDRQFDRIVACKAEVDKMLHRLQILQDVLRETLVTL